MSSSDPISPLQPTPPDIAQLRDSPVEDPVWNLLDVIAIFAFILFSVFVVGRVALEVAKYLPFSRNVKPADLIQNGLFVVPVQVVAYLLVIAFMVQIVRLRQGNGFLASISWNLPNRQKILFALLGSVGLGLFSSIFAGLTSRWVPKSLPVDNYFHDTASSYLFALFGLTFAPLVEELFFRGFLYPALTRRIGMASAVILTSASFAVIHQGQLAHAWVPLAWLFLVGTVFTLVRAKTRSVALSLVVHVGYNATIFALIFISTQGFHHMETYVTSGVIP